MISLLNNPILAVNKNYARTKRTNLRLRHLRISHDDHQIIDVDQMSSGTIELNNTTAPLPSNCLG